MVFLYRKHMKYITSLKIKNCNFSKMATLLCVFFKNPKAKLALIQCFTIFVVQLKKKKNGIIFI